MAARPTVATVDMAALKYNYDELRKRLSNGTKVMAVVKANAYGHGDVQVSLALEGYGCDQFGVALVEEGVRLREGAVKRPIVVLGGVYDDQIDDIFSYDLTPVVFDLDTVRLIGKKAEREGTRKKVHVKVDTGMGRLGLLSGEVVPFFTALKDIEGVAVEGVMSHFSMSDAEDEGFSTRQVALFKESLAAIKSLGFEVPLAHMANSAAAVAVRGAEMDLVRPGLMLYGSYPAPRFKKLIDLRPALTLSTRILQLKEVAEGSPVSYSKSFVTKRASVIATLPIGYGDGLARNYSDVGGEVLVKGRRAPVVGVVCMDLTMVDVTDVKGVRTGDEVVIIGTQGSETIRADEVAATLSTVPYEVYCAISSRVPRVYLNTSTDKVSHKDSK